MNPRNVACALLFLGCASTATPAPSVRDEHPPVSGDAAITEAWFAEARHHAWECDAQAHESIIPGHKNVRTCSNDVARNSRGSVMTVGAANVIEQTRLGGIAPWRYDFSVKIAAGEGRATWFFGSVVEGKLAQASRGDVPPGYNCAACHESTVPTAIARDYVFRTIP
ncbi:MAG: hypothetical protein HOO96_09570 [Polyangiaceae bacterium]|nr:hypothetical protein [Polyangiaceae bacterium]